MLLLKPTWFAMMTIAGAVVFAPAGCGSRYKTPPVASRVEIQDESPKALTPAEKDQRFKSLFDQGIAHIRGEQYGPALASFEEAVRLKPEDPDALFNLGACHEAVGDPLAAINLYRDVLTIRPDDADCYANLGTSFIKMYHREKRAAWKRMATAAWERSLALNPQQPRVQGYLASCRAP
ncbi:MAG TPA: tetratricopeptide repeat protein [Phycisphaerae bacterium]|nr:tetratricopeptide repeat protein [Phycisphaerae bacterium]